MLKSYQLNSLSLVVNMVRGDLLLSRECLSPKEISELLRTPLLGVLPEEYSIYEGDLQTVHPSFKLMAGNLLTGRKKLFDVTKKYSGFFGNVRRVLKRRL